MPSKGTCQDALVSGQVVAEMRQAFKRGVLGLGSGLCEAQSVRS